MQQASARPTGPLHIPTQRGPHLRRVIAARQVEPAEPAQSPASDADVLPRGLRHLMDLGRATVEHRLALPARLRLVLRTPTLAGAAASIASGALAASWVCSGCSHRNWQVGSDVSTALSGRFTDGRVTPSRRDGTPEVNAVGLIDGHDIVHALPTGFPERGASSVDETLRDGLVSHFELAAGTAARFQSRRSAHPVIVVENPSRLGHDATWLPTPTGSVPASTDLSPAHDLTSWFRSPVLTTSRLPYPGRHDWLDELEPRLVVVSGSAALRSSHLGRWPSVPTIVLLSRRSPSDCDTDLAMIGGQRVEPLELAGLMTTRSGVEAIGLVEPATTPAWAGGDDQW